MKKIFTLLIQFTAVMLCALEIVPAGKKYLYKTGEEIVFKVTLDKNRKDAKVQVRVAGNAEPDRNYTANADSNGVLEVRCAGDKPGFIYVEVKNSGSVARAGAGVEPEKIVTGRPCPESFDQYWQSAVKRLSLMPLSYEIKEIAKPRKGFKAFELQIGMEGETTNLFAVMTMPEDAQPGRLAAEVVFHGAGTDKVFPLYRNETMVLSVNPMSIKHEGKQSSTIRQKDGQFYQYYYWGVNDLQKNYFPGMFKRAFRALQFIKSQPQWDHRTLIVRGGSQGGAQSLVAAALDPQVTLCIACVPALCDHGGNEAGRVSGWPRYFTREEYKNDPDKAAKLLDMIDVAFFARNIRNPQVLVTAGFIDRTCVADSVYAAYNLIPAKNKAIANDFLTAHTVSKETSKRIEKLITEHIRKNHEIFK